MLHIKECIERDIIGQTEACQAASQAILKSELGPCRGFKRPKNSFLLLGPTGVGKTSLVLSMLKNIYSNNPKKFARLDMAEFQSSDSIKLLVGKDKEEQGCLGDIIDKLKDGGMILCDEIEKAHPNVIKIFLSILDEGHVSMSTGQTKHLNNIYIFFTSNLGCKKIALANRLPSALIDKIIIQSAEEFFSPELLARFKTIIIFKSLSTDSQIFILKKTILEELNLWENQFGLKFDIDEELVIPFIMRKVTNKKLGVRPFISAVENHIGNAILDFKIASQAKQGIISVDDDRIIITSKKTF